LSRYHYLKIDLNNYY